MFTFDHKCSVPLTICVAGVLGCNLHCHPQDLEAIGNMPLVMSTFQAGSRTKAIGLGMGPQDILHRCVLDVLKMFYICLSINPRKRVLGAATENRSPMRETQACVYDAITQAIIDNAGAMFFIDGLEDLARFS